MRIGIISDIHADIASLDKALHQLHQHREVDIIICAGDLTGYGDYPNEVIERIRAEDIPTVKGNHDSPSAKITSKNADFLRQLPMAWHCEIQNVSLYMCHGIPDVNFIGITRNTFWNHEKGRQRLIDMFHRTRSDILISGHTHQPLLLKTDLGIHFNPGSLNGLDPNFSSHTYGILTLPDIEFDVFDLLSEKKLPID